MAKKLSDFDKNLTAQKTICVDLLVKISSKSDNFLARFLKYLKGPSVEYLISVYFEHTQSYVKQKPRRLSWALTLRLGPTVGELWLRTCLAQDCTTQDVTTQLLQPKNFATQDFPTQNFYNPKFCNLSHCKPKLFQPKLLQPKQKCALIQ